MEQGGAGCCVVFTAHHAVSDALSEKLKTEKYTVGVLDGRVLPAKRSALVSRFQGGELDVLICGVYAAGEGITLHRADTVVFAELDWVPGALQQAEARIHRLGQSAATCWTYYVLVDAATIPPDRNVDVVLWDALSAKLQTSNAVFREYATLETAPKTAGDESLQTSAIRRLLGR
jgi:superfamily II DNA or RNA helicase